MAQVIAYQFSEVKCEDHSAIQVPKTDKDIENSKQRQSVLLEI